MPEAYPTPLAGQKLTAALLRSMQPQTVRKTADTSRQATTTKTPDPHLQFAVAANAVYTIDGWIIWDGADNTADIAIQLTLPTGAQGNVTMWGTGNQVIGSDGTPTLKINTSDAHGYMQRSEAMGINAWRNFGALNGSQPLTFLVAGTARIGSTAGTISVDWAQAASVAFNTTLYTDSWLRFQRIA